MPDQSRLTKADTLQDQYASEGRPGPVLVLRSTNPRPLPTLRMASWHARLIGSIVPLEGSQEVMEFQFERRKLDGEHHGPTTYSYG